MDDVETRAAAFISAIEQDVPKSDELSSFGDEEEQLIFGYVPLTDYETVLDLAEKHGARETAPYVVEGTGEMCIAFDIEEAN